MRYILFVLIGALLLWVTRNVQVGFFSFMGIMFLFQAAEAILIGSPSEERKADTYSEQYAEWCKKYPPKPVAGVPLGIDRPCDSCH